MSEQAELNAFPMGAGRELDARIATEVMALPSVEFHLGVWRYKNEAASKRYGLEIYVEVPLFSTDIDSAMYVLKRMAAPGFDVRIHCSGAGTFDIEWTVDDTVDERNEIWLAEVCDADSLPLAICLAALQTKDTFTFATDSSAHTRQPESQPVSTPQPE